MLDGGGGWQRGYIHSRNVKQESQWEAHSGGRLGSLDARVTTGSPMGMEFKLDLLVQLDNKMMHSRAVLCVQLWDMPAQHMVEAWNKTWHRGQGAVSIGFVARKIWNQCNATITACMRFGQSSSASKVLFYLWDIEIKINVSQHHCDNQGVTQNPSP